MENKEYWKERATSLEQKTHQISKKGYEEIIPAFDKARKEIQAKIDVWLNRIADNNNVTLEEARAMLDSRELKDFRMDVQEYIKYGMENELDQRWMKELENASARHHIDKLTALKTQIEAEYQKAFNTEDTVIDNAVKEAYKDRYYRSAYEIEKGFNLENTIGTINEKKLDQIIQKPWATDGQNFSDRVWLKKDQMVDELYKELVRHLATGESLNEAIENMTRFVDGQNKNAKYCAARLIQTEASYFASRSQQECYNDLDVEEYEIVATLDNHTSSICRRMDGQHFKMSEYEAGVTAPPFHVFCRSTTAPYFNDEFSGGTRAARNVDKKTYQVPSNMTYQEWKNKYILDSMSDKYQARYRKYKPYFEANNLTQAEVRDIIENNQRYGLFKSYSTAIKNKWIEKAVTFEKYESVNKEAREEIIGITTFDNIEIKDLGNHVTDRILGDGTDNRLPMPIKNIIKAITTKCKTRNKTNKNRPQRDYRSDIGIVTINLDDYKLVTVIGK